MLQCNFCGAAFRKLQCNFCFRLWHVAAAGFRGVGFRTCWGSTVSNTELSEFFWPSPSSWERTQWVPLSVLFVCKAHSPSFRTTHRVCPRTQWGSVSSLLRNSILSKQYSACFPLTQKYPQYCWEFHEQLWEASPEPLLKKRRPQPYWGGGDSGNALRWIVGLGQEWLWERFQGLSGICPEFLPESPSRTGGMAH